MGRGWKNFKEHDRKSLQCLEQFVSKGINNVRLRTRKEMRSTGEKTYMASEHT